MDRCRAEMLEKFRKERNLHRMHHNRIAQEKNKLVNDIKVNLYFIHHSFRLHLGFQMLSNASFPHLTTNIMCLT